jgi:hypothetical protein
VGNSNALDIAAGLGLPPTILKASKEIMATELSLSTAGEQQKTGALMQSLFAQALPLTLALIFALAALRHETGVEVAMSPNPNPLPLSAGGATARSDAAAGGGGAECGGVGGGDARRDHAAGAKRRRAEGGGACGGGGREGRCGGGDGGGADHGECDTPYDTSLPIFWTGAKKKAVGLIAKLIECCSDGDEDQGAEEAFMGPRDNRVSSVLEAVSF